MNIGEKILVEAKSVEQKQKTIVRRFLMILFC